MSRWDEDGDFFKANPCRNASFWWRSFFCSYSARNEFNLMKNSYIQTIRIHPMKERERKWSSCIIACTLSFCVGEALAWSSVFHQALHGWLCSIIMKAMHQYMLLNRIRKRSYKVKLVSWTVWRRDALLLLESAYCMEIASYDCVHILDSISWQ